jgi:protein-disulfide isomerase
MSIRPEPLRSTHLARRSVAPRRAGLCALALSVVATLLAPPLSAQAGRDTINLREIGYYQGSPDAPVTVVEFSDFGCPFCAMFARGTYPTLYSEFIETGRVRWVYVPFASGNFRNGDDAERAARCAGAQEKFWEMKDLLYGGQRSWGRERRPEATFRSYAAQLGLDEERFDRCYGRDEVREALRASSRAAEALRIRATPSFLIDGQRIEGSVPLNRFRELLQRP